MTTPMTPPHKFSGKLWVYRNSLAQVGDLVPVEFHAVSWLDATQSTPETCGHIWCGFARVSAQDLVPDPAFQGGLRRQTRLAGPVLNSTRTVVIDDAPVFFQG